MPTYRADIDVANDNRTRKRRKIILIVLASLSALCALAYFEARSYLLDGLPTLPDKATMWELNLQPNMTLLDKNGNVIGHRGPYVGEPLKLDDMPAFLPDAFLAIEDERFYEHEGIDNRAILRALLQNTKSGERGQGGSTLTQQLVKTMILTPEKTYRRKFQEALLARDMEAILSKPEILELYMNRISLGPRVFGVEAASQRYFGKSARDINIAEAALLAGLPQAPSRYNPAEHYDRALKRSKLVLQRMVVNRMITLEQHSEALESPPVIREDAKPLIDPNLIGHVFDLVDEQISGLIGMKHKDLIVTTTIDPKLQEHAQASLEKILAKNMKSKKVSEGALVSIDNSTGAIRAMIGGRNYKDSKFNRAWQAKRQPGSSFKTFSYAAALEDGFTPATVRIDQPTNIDGWEPENYTRRYRGPMTLREALKHSINTIAAQITVEIGPSRVGALARRFGIKSELRPEYSLALGSSEVTLTEMTTAYTVFANTGLYNGSYLVTEIQNTAKNPLYKRRASAGTRVYPIPYARQMTSMLKDVVETGTGHGAKMGSRQVGGKTGTSQDYRDAWFIGFSKQYTTGVWMGNDDNSSMREVTGGLLPVDVWKSYMRSAHKGLKRLPLDLPDPITMDENNRSFTAFYGGLSEAFEAERDMANGVAQIKPKPVNGGDTQTAGR